MKTYLIPLMVAAIVMVVYFSISQPILQEQSLSKQCIIPYDVNFIERRAHSAPNDVRPHYTIEEKFSIHTTVLITELKLDELHQSLVIQVMPYSHGYVILCNPLPVLQKEFNMSMDKIMILTDGNETEYDTINDVLKLDVNNDIRFEIMISESEIEPESSPIGEEHYSIEITGMNDIYRIGEQYDFSHIISGYGYSCGSKEITFPDQNGNIMKIISSSSCLAGVPMKDFILDAQKQYDTTSVHGTIKIPGIYNVTVTFDRPSQDFPTIAIKEFRVPPINSWYNNQPRDTDLQTVMDSCTNDSPKERMTNSLRYTNETHVFMNLGCEWKKIGKFMGD